MAWDVTGKGTTVVRAGGGIVYDTISMETLLVQENVQNATTIGLATIPTGAPIVVNGVTTPASGTIAVSSVVIPNLNWNGSSVGGSPIFPAAPIECGDGVGCGPRALQRSGHRPQFPHTFCQHLDHRSPAHALPRTSPWTWLTSGTTAGI